MNEYLDRKQVIELYEKYQPSLATHVYEFGEKLKALPIVKEETSRPHGEWIKDGFFAVCSNCDHELQHYDLVVSQIHFCPNCGADMRKEGESN